jgi:hypothetical protein
MKTVFIITKAKPFGEKIYVGVRSSKKLALKLLRELFPHMRTIGEDMVSDADNTWLLFIDEEPVE